MEAKPALTTEGVETDKQSPSSPPPAVSSASRATAISLHLPDLGVVTVRDYQHSQSPKE